MNILALDTSTNACSVALRCGDRQRLLHEVKPREHTRLLLPMIRQLLDEAEIGSAALDAIVLGNGPGSFIGMRIAASVAQGMAFATGADLVPVSSLQAVAAAALRDGHGKAVLVAQDAHMNEVYLAGYEQDENGWPREVLVPRLQAAARFEAALPGALAAGAGWDRYPALYSENSDWLGDRLPLDHPSADDLLDLGLQALQSGETVRPELLEPAYLREQVATPPA